MLKLVGSHTNKARCCARGTGPLSVPAMSWATLAITALTSPRPAGWLGRPHGGPGSDWGFLLFQVTLPEHTPAGSIILTVSATDPDSGSNGNVTFHLAVPSPDIAIDPSNGACCWLLCGAHLVGCSDSACRGRCPHAGPGSAPHQVTVWVGQ